MSIEACLLNYEQFKFELKRRRNGDVSKIDLFKMSKKNIKNM